MVYRFFGGETAHVQDENGLTPQALYDLLRGLWSRDTCAPRMRADWTEDNPTLGQCSITAFLAQDLFGGRVLGVPLPDGNFHCYNEAGGCVFDLTSEQFGDRRLCYENSPEQLRQVHFAKEEKYQRYLLLRQRLMGEYAVLLKRRGHNCCQAVLLAYAREAGLPADTLRALGAAFGGGMGGMEGTCGALCGAEMALGLTRYQGHALSGAARALHQAFERACGASICRQLKGVDSGAPLCACDDCVRRAAQALEQTRWTLPAT